MGRYLIPTIISLVVAGSLSAADAPATPNLVADGSLEGRLQSNGIPAGWSPYAQFSVIEVYTQSGGKTGERCLKVRSLNDAWAGVGTGRFKLQPGARQSGRVWYRPTDVSGGECIFYINYYNAAGDGIGNSQTVPVPLSEPQDRSKWQLLQVDDVGSRLPDAQTFELVVAFTKPGVALFDDFELYQSVAPAGTPLIGYGDIEIRPEQFAKLFIVTKPDGTASASIEHQNPHQGKACLRLTGKATWAVFRVIDLDVPAGKTIRGTAWKRATKGGGQIHLLATTPEGKVFEQFLDFDTKPQWQETPWKLTPQQLGKATQLQVNISTHDEFDICFDDISAWIE